MIPRVRVYTEPINANIVGLLYRVCVEPINEYGQPIAAVLPKGVEVWCQHQWLEVGSRTIADAEREVISLFQRLEWEVVDWNYWPIDEGATMKHGDT